MRRSLFLTVAATVSMVLVAMLVPLGVMVYNLDRSDRLARAALEVQATETVVAGQDKGAVSVYVDQINGAGTGMTTTVIYADDLAIGPNGGVGERVRQARRTGRARVDESAAGTQLLVPVIIGPPRERVVIRVDLAEPGVGSAVVRAWLILAALGVVLLAGSLLLADRLGRSFVQPIRALAKHAQRIGIDERTPVPVAGPAEVAELGTALERLVERVESLRARERETVADLSHRLRTPITALRLRVDGLADAEERDRLSADLDDLEHLVDHVVHQARRSEREGLVPRCDAVRVLAERAAFWAPLAEDQHRAFEVVAPAQPPRGVTAEVGAAPEDLAAALDVLLDNVFTHTPDGAALRIEARPEADEVTLTVEDAGPGFPDGIDVTSRGISGGGSTGLGLSIVASTAAAAGGSMSIRTSPLGGAGVALTLPARVTWS